jgi:hypothetical protein
MKSLLLLGIGLFIVSNSQIQIRSMVVYNYFRERGYTTAGASTQFEDLKKEQTRKIEVHEADIRFIEKILNSVKSTKHHQTKLGIHNIFCLVTSEAQLIKVIVSPTLIIDLTNYRNYRVEDESQVILLREFMERIRNGGY